MSGEYTELDGGSRNVNLHVSKQYAAHIATYDSEAMPFARGSRGMLPQDNLKKMVQFDIFGEY